MHGVGGLFTELLLVFGTSLLAVALSRSAFRSARSLSTTAWTVIARFQAL